MRKLLLTIGFFISLISQGQQGMFWALNGSGCYTGTLDSDVAAYITRLQAAGYTPTECEKAAVNETIVYYKAIGYYATRKEIYFYLGGTAATHALGFKNAFNLTFNGGWVHSATGAKPNGTTGYANTGILANTLQQYNYSYALYSRDDQQPLNNTGIADIGYYVSESSSAHLYLRSYVSASFGFETRLYAGAYNEGNPKTSSAVSTIGMFIASVPSASGAYISRNGTVITPATTSPIVSTHPALTIYIGAFNLSGNAAKFSNKEYCYADIGDGITSVTAALVSQAVNSFQSRLSTPRNTY